MTRSEMTERRDTSSAISCISVAVRLRAMPWALHPRATPDTHHFVWINKGAGRVHINGTTRGFAPNSAFFLPAGTVFGFDLTPACSGWIVAVPTKVALPQPLPSTDFMQLIGARGDQASLAAICDDINRETLDSTPAAQAAVMCYTGLLSVWLARHAPQTPAKLTPAQRLMGRFTAALETRFSTYDGVAEYAAGLGVTPTHLARVCKATNNCSANSLIQDRKLLEAKIKLIETTERISTIATQSGFASAAYFTRLFSQKTGMSPRSFRTQAKSDPEPGRSRERLMAPVQTFVQT